MAGTDQLSRVFSALADPTRRAILAELAERDATVTELRAPLPLTDVADGDLLEGVMHVTGRLHDDIEPFETRFRVEFHDEPNGRTRLAIRQWLPRHLAGPSNQGWLEALEKLDAALVHLQAAVTDAPV
jgi:DNA-binding transcriptional ArsR family regulator